LPYVRLYLFVLRQKVNIEFFIALSSFAVTALVLFLLEPIVNYIQVNINAIYLVAETVASYSKSLYFSVLFDFISAYELLYLAIF